jgi:hypothetical protein
VLTHPTFPMMWILFYFYYCKLKRWPHFSDHHTRKVTPQRHFWHDLTADVCLQFLNLLSWTRGGLERVTVVSTLFLIGMFFAPNYVKPPQQVPLQKSVLRLRAFSSNRENKSHQLSGILPGQVISSTRYSYLAGKFMLCGLSGPL